MKTLVEEQEIQSSTQPITQERSAQTIVRAVPRLPESKPRTIETSSNVDGYERCLDLAAEFLARG